MSRDQTINPDSKVVRSVIHHLLINNIQKGTKCKLKTTRFEDQTIRQVIDYTWSFIAFVHVVVVLRHDSRTTDLKNSDLTLSCFLPSLDTFFCSLFPYLLSENFISEYIIIF